MVAGPPPDDPGEEALELIPALEPRDPKSAYLFYDCQTDDVRLVLTILGEAERFGAVMANRAEVTSLLERGGRAEGVVCRDGESGERIEIRGRQRRQRHRRLGGPDPARRDPPTRPRCRGSRPSRGTHVTLPLELLPLDNAACIVPAGEGRTIFVLPWYGRALVGTTDKDYDGDIDHVEPGGDDIEYLLDAVNALLRDRDRRRRPDRRLRRRAPADLDRRPEEVGRHLAQGGALRDLLGDAHDHRRQAHDLAADGEAGRRPDRDARGA